MKRHICFFTGKRGGFTHFVPIFEEIDKNSFLKYSIFASDMHLSGSFGKTIKSVEKRAQNVYKIDTLINSDSKVARAKSIGIGILSYSQMLDMLKPDLVFLLGDRGEVLAMAIAAMELNIPIIHLFGGDITQGGVDELVRHAITKLANIHLTSNQSSADRILKMGEDSWRIYKIGSPALDLIKQSRFTNKETIFKKFSLYENKPVILLLQHSVTWQVDQTEKQIIETLKAITEFDFQIIAVYPCSDPGYETIINNLEKYSRKTNLRVYKNIEFEDFWGLMNIANIFIGNSSAGIMETASFKIPFINIGIRQEGRLRADNVIDVAHDRDKIKKAIQKSLFDSAFIKQVQNCISPYGDGTASKKIVSILENLKLDSKLIQKKMTY